MDTNLKPKFFIILHQNIFYMFDSIIFIILAVILFIVAFKIIKSIIKAIMIGLFIILFVVGCFGLVLYMDYSNLRDGLGQDKAMFILEDNGVILTGLMIEKQNETTYHLFGSDELVSINEKYLEDDFKGIKDEAKRLYIVNIDFFDTLNDDVQFIDQFIDKVKKETIKKVMTSATPLESYIDLNPDNVSAKEKEKAEFDEMFKTQEDFRSAMFLLSTNQIIEQEGVEYIYKEYKKGNVTVYPKTMVFFLINLMPSWLVNIIFMFL